MKDVATTASSWLFKEVPNHHAYKDLERAGETLWNGVFNALARKNLRNVKQRDRVLYFPTGTERAIVGEKTFIESPKPNPEDNEPKAVVVKMRAVRAWPIPVTLRQIKADEVFERWDLARLLRLSIVAVSAK